MVSLVSFQDETCQTPALRRHIGVLTGPPVSPRGRSGRQLARGPGADERVERLGVREEAVGALPSRPRAPRSTPSAGPGRRDGCCGTDIPAVVPRGKSRGLKKQLFALVCL